VGALLGSRSLLDLQEEPSATCPDGAHPLAGAEEDLAAKLVSAAPASLMMWEAS